ncbi:helix-turn-helix domain-containing protein [Ensifer canadensis]|uniref:helix-turn-helix domain-containing protein n=1 Tax=Ensifer canadensis TaxID=555315 RepID=UPI0035E3D8BE
MAKPRSPQLSQIEARAIAEALKAANGNISKAARALGLTRAKLRHRLSGKIVSS